MKKWVFAISILFFISACKDDNAALNENILFDYLELNEGLELGDIVACAGGRAEGLLGSSMKPTDVFFYPIPGATDFRYFEAENVADSNDFSKYVAKPLESEPIFNGYLWKFNNTPFSGEKMGVVTYKTLGKIHRCTPIHLKTNLKPTEVNSDLVNIMENGVRPSFSWSSGQIDENVIYFHVISDANDSLISGTYTIEKNFTFYDLSNVVFNITDPSLDPILLPNNRYKFTLMGVSEDNWVNLFAEKEFSTF